MSDTRRIIRAISNLWPGGGKLEEWIADCLEGVSSVKGRLREFRLKELKIRKEISELENSLSTQLAEIRESCPHYITTGHLDSSGECYPFVSCDICGEDIQR